MKEHPPVRSVVLSFDEKGKTPVKQYGGCRWTAKQHYRIPYAQKVKGLFDLFAAKNIHTGKRHHRFYTWKNSFIVIDFVNWLLYTVYPEHDLYLILDGVHINPKHSMRMQICNQDCI